jgi:hypothetical protein
MATSSVSISSPKIAFIYDNNHLDLNEETITAKLSTIDFPKIVVFMENRYIEDKTLKHYSLELLSQDKPISTATPCSLLIAHICTRRYSSYLQSILKTIYTDSYLKKLFIEAHYSKYHPNKYGLIKKKEWLPLVNANFSAEQQLVIENVKNSFKKLDEELPKKPSYFNREAFIEDYMEAVAEDMNHRPDCDTGVFAPISEALAFIKIQQVQNKLNSDTDKSKELSLSIINQLYDEKSVGTLLKELNQTFRTQFQAQKVINTVEKILKSPDVDKDTIFVVRVGSQHRDLTNRLTQHFESGEFKEISLKKEDLHQVEQKIQEQFFS